MNIPDEILAYVDSHRLCMETMRELAPRLPESDEGLHEWLDDAITNMEPEVFGALVFAALSAGRKMRASFFPRAINLLIAPVEACAVASHLEGDAAEAICEGLRTGAANLTTSSQLCLLAADWSMKHRGGKAPAYLRTRLCSIARNKNLTREDMVYVIAAARILQDDMLMGMLLPHYPGEKEELRTHVLDTALKAGHSFIEMYARPVSQYINSTPNRVIATGRMPMRRAVARTGSNEPCPCGSGKKYKRCCLAKDAERLRHSSEVSGMTWREARRGREPFLTADTLRTMGPADLYHMDVRKLRPDLVPWYFVYAAALMQFDVCVRGLRLLGWDAQNETIRESWKRSIFIAGLHDRREAVKALYEVVPDPAEADALMEPLGHAVSTSNDPAAHLAALERIAHEALLSTNHEVLQKAALGLLHCACPSLGILAARSAIPLLPRKDADFILQQIFEARDRLHLPPEDPFSDVLEKRFAAEVPREARDAEGTRRVRRQLEAKACEVRNLRAQLDHLQHSLDKKERKAPAPSATRSETPAAAAAPDESLKDLRRKVGELKGLLQQRQEERSALRSELEKTHAELEKARAKAAPPAAAPHSDESEDALFFPAEPGTTQPVRLPVFPHKFQDTLHLLPRHTARHTLEAIGHLCGGDASAFHGVVRLKAAPSVFRIRIGIDHRLLFRLSGDTLEVVDLINRRDLERRIRSLQS